MNKKKLGIIVITKNRFISGLVTDGDLRRELNKNPKIKNLNNVLIGHFLDLGWKNPYGETDPVIYAGTNSSQDRDGRMRIDETECPGGYSNGARIALWIKTHKEYYPALIEKDGWCKN